MNITIPSNVKYIIDEFYKNNYEAFMVGGCIRDALLCKVPKDYDIATSAKPEITEKLFEKTIPTGIKHGTVTVLIDNEPYEVTTYRTEGEYKDNRRPDEVYFVSDIKEDLSRRDFTINAFAYNSREGLKDFFGGLNDLNNSLIRSVGDANKRFNEDALRMLRAIRFSTQLNFYIEENTLNAIQDNKDLIKNISAERIRDELCKILLSNNVRKGLKLLEKCGLLQIIIPEIVPSIGFDQKNIYHFEDVFNHTLSVIEKCPEDLTIRLAALLHDIGKPDVFFIDDNGNGRFFGHNTRSEKIARDILNRLRFDNKTIKSVCILVREHMNVLDNASNLAIKRLINRVSKENIYSLLALQKADILSLKDPNVALYKVSDMKNKIDNIINSNTPLTVKDLAIDGGILVKELDLKPGKIIGETLDYLLQLVLKDSSLNTKLILLEKSKTFIKNKKG
ncbi:CCA tRNA nucleotidyltransferase [Clostridium baratii]|uniref:tRNA nucleotidyltransferase/poly(A) polymerase n=1 Tax=Clostridium baratii TaxID=1561 RepID=A0A174UJG2_9CLOT|nr:CCA tRNA nucleotidyltransferase [Clostridium baratii]CUQ19850.1 tRNA nucleotidyltransferase/poly(A) polymerase [Clostridium baratii]